MKQDTKTVVIFGTVLLLMVVVTIQVWISRGGYELRSSAPQITNPVGERVPMRLGDVQIMVEVRDTDEERAQGLSGRAGLGDTEGMAFVFDTASQPTFWMKEMLFPLDIVWVRDGKVVQIDEEIPPPTVANPRAVTVWPQVPIDTVVEVAAGFASLHGLSVGDTVSWE